MLLGLSVGAVSFTIWQLRNDAINAAINDTGNIAAILAGQFSRSLNTIDTMLIELRSSEQGPQHRHARQGSRHLRHPEMREAMRAHLATLPHTLQHRDRGRKWAACRYRRRHGRRRTSMSATGTTSRSARARVDGRLSTSVPIRNRIDGNQTIVFARRLETPSGAFAGVIFASVNSSYFESIYASTQSIKSLIFNLIREDGTILFRHPGRRGLCRQTAFAGKHLAGFPQPRHQELPDSGEGRQQLPLCVGPRRAGIPAVREYLGRREHRARGMAPAFGDDRPRQRGPAPVFDLPVDRDDAASPGPEQLGGAR